MLQLGLRLHDAEKKPLEPMLSAVREQGFTCAHLALRKLMPEIPCTVSSLTPGYAQYLKKAFEKADLSIAVLGNYLNLLHPDEAYLKDAKEMYLAHIRFASQLGCGMVGTETGAPNAAYSFTPECREEKTLSLFIKRLKPIVRYAEEFGVIFAIEPVARHAVWCPKACRRVLDEIGSPNLQVLFDPVNLLDLENVDGREEIFAEMMESLGKDIAMIHFKDFVRFEEGSGLKAVGAGMGEMDYTSILRWLKAEKPFIWATLENTNPGNAVRCRETIQGIYDSI